MRKWFVRCVLGLFGVIAFGLVGTWLLNSFDEPLLPEVKAIVEKESPLTEQQRKSYFFMLGLYAGDEKDPEKRGMELWNQRQKADVWKGLEKREPWTRDSVACGEKEACSVEVLHHHPEFKQILEKNRKTAAQYTHLMEYGAGTNYFREELRTPLTSFLGHPLSSEMHKLFLLQLAEWLERGEKDKVWKNLELSNRFMQGFYQESFLIEGMLATHFMTMNADFLQAEIKRNPRTVIPRSLYESFLPLKAESLLSESVKQETRAVYMVTRELKLSQTGVGSRSEDVFDNPARLFDLIPVKILLRPNETVNQYYSLMKNHFGSDCGNAIEKCLAQMTWFKNKWPWDYLINPVGKGLLPIFLRPSDMYQVRIDQRAADLLVKKEEFAKHITKELDP